MVTVHREHGLRFVIYLDDHEPAHVHVFGDGELKVTIVGRDGLPEVVYAVGMKAGDRRKALDVMKDAQDWFLAEWNRLQGEGQ
ncbi:MAG: hypothetical protein C0515_05200 [Novosphingobium sp.]|nr:hypothetical protein [Novosphingobium sp.]